MREGRVPQASDARGQTARGIRGAGEGAAAGRFAALRCRLAAGGVDGNDTGRHRAPCHGARRRARLLDAAAHLDLCRGVGRRRPYGLGACAAGRRSRRSRRLPHQAHRRVRGARARRLPPRRGVHAGQLAPCAAGDRLHREGRTRALHDGGPRLRRGGAGAARHRGLRRLDAWLRADRAQRDARPRGHGTAALLLRHHGAARRAWSSRTATSPQG